MHKPDLCDRHNVHAQAWLCGCLRDMIAMNNAKMT